MAQSPAVEAKIAQHLANLETIAHELRMLNATLKEIATLLKRSVERGH